MKRERIVLSVKGLVAGLLGLLLLPPTALAGEPPQWEFGLRGGTDASCVEESYRVGELYLLRGLPWQTSLGGVSLSARLDFGVGYLEADQDRGNWLAAGADLVLSMADGTVNLEAGFRPTWLTDHYYGDDNFGGDMQFTSHVGLDLHFSPMVLSYRYQHMSNAGIYQPNGGLNLHLLGIGATF